MGGAPPLLAMNGQGYTNPCARAQWEFCKWTVNPAVNQDQQYGWGSTSASYEWAGLYVLHVHNESSASEQAPEEEGPGSC